MRPFIAILLWTAATSAFPQTSSLQIHGFLTGRNVYVKSQPSWSEGGFGRFDVGAERSDLRRTASLLIAQAGIDWTPSAWLLIHADGIARKEPSGAEGRRAGLLQTYIDLHSERLRLRVGSFWLPTSRENVDPLWNSRYTITYSALNTWIGEEGRPIGADLQYSPNFYVTLGATAFRGVDTMGTALAARGWAFGNRLTVYDEVIAAVPDTTKPIGGDIDGKNGYAERIRFQLPERALLQITHIDNRADLLIRNPPEVPWHTKLNIVGGEIGSTAPTILAAEWASGSTALAFPGGSFTMDFETTYVLLSRKSGRNRWTARVDRFSTRDHSRPPDDFNREHGNAVTLVWLFDVRPNLRAGLEYVRVNGDRPAALDPKTGGSTGTIELRYEF